MGVFIGQSTPIYDREADTISYGRVPAGAVVVAGSLPKNGGKYNSHCPVIVKRLDEGTRKDDGVNGLLREQSGGASGREWLWWCVYITAFARSVNKQGEHHQHRNNTNTMRQKH